MRRTRLYQILICLLCLSPTWSQAQSLTQYEYWFDDDYSGRETVGLSGYEADIDVGINASSLGNGLHKFSLRVKQSDGMYSSVTTGYFFKAQVSDGGKLEYWFDGKKSASKTISGNISSDGEAFIFNSGLELTAVTPGYHSMFYRFTNDDGTTSSAVSMSSVFVTPNLTDGGKLEYWFDGNRKSIYTVDGKVSSDGKGYIINSGLDLTAVSPGHHSMYYRFINGDGTMSSAVSMSSVFVTPNLTDGGKLEYWFDDDREKVNTVDGKVSSDGEGLIFISDLDLNTVSQGSHRMYYRLIDSKGKPNSAVSMTPLMVKSMYLTEAKTSKVVSYSVSVDDQTPVVMDVLNPSEEVTIPHNYDARALSAGEHTVKTKIWNSLGTVVSDETKFTVVEQEAPSIVLEASEKDGIVTTSFNSIPNDLRYRIIRKDADGNKAKVADYKVSYPNAIIKTDEPVDGTYTYYVQAIYTDYQGNQCLVTSNEVAVTVAKSQETTEPKVVLGSIIGCIKIDNQQVAMMPLNLQMDVTFSDGVVIKSGANGMFIRDGIPVGTELSMTVKNNDNYTFTTPSVVVDENTRKKIYAIYATPVKNQVVEKSNESYDLVINSDITGIPNYFKFEVKNATDKAWSGRIHLIAVKEKEDKNEDGALSFASLKPYHKVGSAAFSDLKSGAKASVELEVTDFPVLNKNTFYNFYLISESDFSKGNYKLVETIGDVAMNPRRIEIEKTPETSVGTSEAAIEQAVNDILSTMKYYKKYGGYLANALSFYAETGSLYGEDTKALAAFVKDLKEHLKGVGDIASFVSDVKKYYEGYEIYRDWNTMDDFDKFVLITNKIFEWSGPCGKIYQTYLEVLERCKNAVDKILEAWFPYDLASVYSRNIMKFHIKVIKKDTNWLGMKSYYSGEEIYNAIKQIEIRMYTPAHGYYNNYYKNPVKKSDELVMIKMEGVADQGSEMEKLDGMRFYMKIDWKNGRTSFVPLLSKEIVKYSSNTEVTVTFKSESSEMADIIHLVPVE